MKVVVVDPGLIDRRETVYSTLEQEGISPEDLTALVVDAIAERKIHIFSHPEWFDVWQQRVDKVRTRL